MILCITEKPSVAKDIANILGASARHDGFYEGNGYQVSWTYGHLCMLKEPSDYTQMWKSWALSYLPMIPQRFGIKLINDKNIIRQFHVLETLIGKCDQVINCGDAGQEGELIQRWVMQKANCHVPVMRLWISSLTDESIRNGFQDLKPESDYDNLYYAGLSRAIGDWILGMNATRLYSLKYSSPGNVLSVGRVQTPTLALIVKRHFEIVNFRPEDYWELKTLYRDVVFNATTGKFNSIEKANAALEQIKGKPFTVTDVQQKKGKESPPRLFDLTSLQVECNKLFGWTADETLKLIQSCYEKKVTTYPRVDTTYLTDDMYNQVPVILQKMTPYASLTAPVLAKKLPKSKKVFDNSKVTDHHAIIPTGESPTVLVGNERRLYHLIAMRFISAFYPDCVFSQTTVTGKVEEIGFKAVGKVILDPGWRVLFDKPKPKPDPNNPQASASSSPSAAQSPQNGGNGSDGDGDNDQDDSEDRILPPMTVGESGPHEPSLLKKTTQPPKYYTEGTLLRAMETAGKTVDDEQLREAMKENGIGRPSTRSAIIETLFKRRYIERKRKQIVPTPAGIQLIGTIKEELLKSAKLTGLWENKLRRIERGDYTAADFIQELKEMIHKITYDVLADNEFKKIEIENGEHRHHHGSTSTTSTSSRRGQGSSSGNTPTGGSNSATDNNASGSGNGNESGTGSGTTRSSSRRRNSSTTGSSTTSTRRRSSKKSASTDNQGTNTATTGGNTGAQGTNTPGTSPNPSSPPIAPSNPRTAPTNPPSGTSNSLSAPTNPNGTISGPGAYHQNNPNAYPPSTPHGTANTQGNPNPNSPNGYSGYPGHQGTYPTGYPNGSYPANYPTGGNPTANPNGYTGYNGYPGGYPQGNTNGYGSYPGSYRPAGYQNNPSYPNPNGYQGSYGGNVPPSNPTGNMANSVGSTSPGQNGYNPTYPTGTGNNVPNTPGYTGANNHANPSSAGSSNYSSGTNNPNNPNASVGNVGNAVGNNGNPNGMPNGNPNGTPNGTSGSTNSGSQDVSNDPTGGNPDKNNPPTQGGSLDSHPTLF